MRSQVQLGNEGGKNVERFVIVLVLLLRARQRLIRRRGEMISGRTQGEVQLREQVRSQVQLGNEEGKRAERLVIVLVLLLDND